ncbi:hypothetical protein [Lysinibacter cavernae]|uniref:Uncharacterized protein n=1 Tax=Lysinibacter cavernae TaxID=1640652 RepID=A0A7X5QZ11_9MICO|nr:hypothetical protein [Lysinibacter cavernae]NIH52549.1 hypothetical protein [Lysinibacter cavernae]
MATKTTKTTTPTKAEYDFDSWTDDAEEKAIAAIVPDVRYIIVGDTFVGRFADKVTVELPLKLSLDIINELAALSDDPLEQLVFLLTKLGGAEAAAEFTKHDVAETAVLASKFFTILQRVTQASLPE